MLVTIFLMKGYVLCGKFAIFALNNNITRCKYGN